LKLPGQIIVPDGHWFGSALLDHAGIDPPRADDAHGLCSDFTIADAPMIAPIAPRIYG
jgi:hypothetical protein